MRSQSFIIIAVVIVLNSISGAASRLNSPGQAAPAAPSAAQDPATHPAPAAGLTGTWKSTPDRTPLTTDLQVSIWGPNAESVRVVDLVVRPSGEATLKVTTRIVDARGRTVPASTSVEEAQLMLTGSLEKSGVRTEHGVKVVRAERRYLDNAKDRWTLDGLRVSLTAIDGEKDKLEVRVDTAEGRGSFWDTVTRTRATPARGAS